VMMYDGYLADNIPLLTTYAITQGQTSVIRDLTAQDRLAFGEYRDALTLALQCGRHEIVAMLLEYGHRRFADADPYAELSEDGAAPDATPEAIPEADRGELP